MTCLAKQACLVGCLCLILTSTTVSAQIIQQQTVQLPTFHYFGVSTTVVVPDRGSIPLGGVTYSSMGRTRFDRVGSSYGQSFDSVGLSMSATIIDNAEMDRALLAEAARRRGAKFDVLGRPVPASIAKSIDGELYLRRGRDAEATGQPEVAKVFYRRAAKLGNAEAKRTAQERLAELNLRSTK